MAVKQSEQAEEGGAVLTLYIEVENPEVETLLLATEQGIRTRQYKFHFDQAAKAEVHLPPGKYLVQVVTREHHPANLVAFLEPDSTTEHTVVLEPREDWLPTFEERLEAYGISPKQAVEKVELEETEWRVIENKEEQPGLICLKAGTLQDVRQFVGAPFGVFDHDEPRFGTLEVPEETIERLCSEAELTAEDHVVLNNLVGEHLYGNELAYAELMTMVAPYIAALVAGSFWVHAYRELTIPAGATYQFGPGTLVLDRLRIHTTGKLIPKGQCKFDIGHWEEFS
jgi:hypothetical protein